MGMFDLIKCSANIGELTDVECQTKDIDGYDEGGTMSFYWVDPNRVLWYPDYSGTYDFKRNESSDKLLWVRNRNGNRGKVVRSYLTKVIEVYASKTQPDGLVDFVSCILNFDNGVLQENYYK